MKISQGLRAKRIGVIYGGWSAERAISLQSGRAVCASLKRLGLRFAPIDATRNVAGQVRRANINLAFLAMHGPGGEDGSLQGLLDVMHVPYTGCGVLASAAAMHKPTAKTLFASAGVSAPKGFVVRRGEPLPRLTVGRGWVVKPASQGSAIGVSLVKKPSEWRGALKAAFAQEDEILVEELIEGTEVTVGILGDRALPVIEIVPRHAFYDFYSKYAAGGSRHIVPARLSRARQREVSALALKAFKALGGRHFARMDFIVPKRGRPVILEANTLPGLTSASLLPDAARAVGLSFDGLILEMLEMAARDAARK